MVGRGRVVSDNVIQADGSIGTGSARWRKARRIQVRRGPASRSRVGRGRSCFQDLGACSEHADKTGGLGVGREEEAVLGPHCTDAVLCPPTAPEPCRPVG